MSNNSVTAFLLPAILFPGELRQYSSHHRGKRARAADTDYPRTQGLQSFSGSDAFQKVRQLPELVGLEVDVHIQEITKSVPLITDGPSNVQGYLIALRDVLA
jgi:hypothetical protein